MVENSIALAYWISL